MNRLQLRLAVMVSGMLLTLAALRDGIERRRRLVRGDAGIELIAVAGIAAMTVAFLAIIYAAFHTSINAYLAKL